MIHENFPQASKISANKERGPNFWGEPILQKF